VLASASAGRLGLLRAAGFAPEVVVTGVSEDDVVDVDTRVVVQILARRKAEAAVVGAEGALVLGCDSLFDIDGVAQGKAASPSDAIKRWRARRGRTGTLYSGHCLIDSESGASAEAVAGARVTFGEPTDLEIRAYAATDEAVRVAGAFTIDGYAAPFIDHIEGHPSTVVGCSLPVIRTLLKQLGVEITDLWA
jgi:septum formation protein